MEEHGGKRRKEESTRTFGLGGAVLCDTSVFLITPHLNYVPLNRRRWPSECQLRPKTHSQNSAACTFVFLREQEELYVVGNAEFGWSNDAGLFTGLVVQEMKKV